MTSPSLTTEAAFIAIVVAVAAIFVYAVLNAARDAGHPVRSSLIIVAIVLVAWLVVPAILAKRGLLNRYDPLPAPALLLVGALTIGTIVLAFSGVGSRLIAGMPLAGLVGYQVFRVAVELVLHRLYTEGVIPVEMTYAGRNFDIVSGVLAGALGLWLWKGNRGLSLVLLWNILGLALLANIVVIAILSTPVPFRHFTNGPANLLPSTFPYVWLPSFLVQAALFGHLLIFRAISRRKNNA